MGMCGEGRTTVRAGSLPHHVSWVSGSELGSSSLAAISFSCQSHLDSPPTPETIVFKLCYIQVL